MLELLMIVAVAGIIVVGIDIYNNRWYDKLIQCRCSVVKYRIRHLDNRDVNWMLEITGNFIELNNNLYVNNMQTVEAVGVIPTSRAYKILADKLCGC